MSEVDHVGLVEVLYVSIDDIGVFEQNRASSDSFLHIPVHSLALYWCRSWEMIRGFEFICVEVITVRVYKLSLELAVKSNSECTDSGVDVGTSIDGVWGFNFPFLREERRRDVFGHIEVPSVDDCINYVLFCVG